MRYFSLILTLLLFVCTLGAQNYGELKREEFGDGLYKVQSGDVYGIFDNNDKVIVSVEYENILLSIGGLAVLRKNNGFVYGSVTDKGVVSIFKKPYKYHINYPFYAEGYLPVRNTKESSKEKWFYVDDKGEQLKKNVGGFLLPMTFRSVMPFNDGYASVINARGEVLHIDETGQERFVIDDEVVLFRASVNDGEAIIVTTTGVKLYQEDKDTNKANVKRVISRYYSYEVTQTDLVERHLEFKDGTLYLDYLGRASKYVPKNGEPIVFGVQEKVVKEEVTVLDTLTMGSEPLSFSIVEGLSVSLKQKVVSASSNGWAGVTVLLRNKSQIHSGVLTVTMKSKGITPKESLIEISPSETKSVKISLPAQFSEAQKTQEVTVEISGGGNVVEEKLSVVLKRYEATSIL